MRSSAQSSARSTRGSPAFVVGGGGSIVPGAAVPVSSGIMLSPKMQRNIRVNDSQLAMLSERAHYDHSLAGYLHKRTADSAKWQLRWFVLYQNLLFYYDSDSCSRPSGVLLLEGCYCERLITAASASKNKENADKQHCFAISYRRENQRQYELRAGTESDCKTWIEAIREASFNKLLLQKEELEQKHLHLLQIVESEKTAKWQYTQQCEELASEIKKLRAELFALKREWRPVAARETANTIMLGGLIGSGSGTAGLGGLAGPGTGAAAAAAGGICQDETEELRKIKKVQSFFRGWLCRRRWKQIVDEYIKSPHAESMRKRNSLVFRMVEAEEEYMEQMEVLVSCFLRPFKMAASSKKPPCSHEDVNSIFLNSETVLFLHQIFLKGLTSRMESWPTLVLGDLFDMLLPMLSIYQEYVRNHHYSLQVLTECKQSPPFAALLTRLENKPACQGRSLETFLTYPMHQVPRYIITLHELLAHTPHDHVERKSLENARQQLEDLSRQMHDEVSGPPSRAGGKSERQKRRRRLCRRLGRRCRPWELDEEADVVEEEEEEAAAAADASDKRPSLSGSCKWGSRLGGALRPLRISLPRIETGRGSCAGGGGEGKAAASGGQEEEEGPEEAFGGDGKEARPRGEEEE